MSQPRRNDFLIPTLGVLFDAVAIESAFFASYFIRFDTTLLKFLPLNEDVPPLDAYLLSSLAVLPVWLFLFQSQKMYGARRNVSLSDELLSVIKIVTLGMLIVMSAAFFYREFSYSRVVFVLLWMSSIVFISIGKVIVLGVEKSRYQQGRDLRNAIVIGNNEMAKRFFDKLHLHPALGYKLIGYAADTKSNGLLANIEYLGTISDVQNIIMQREIELVFIALNYDEHQKLYKLVQECEGMNIEFLMVPDVVEVMTSGVKVQEFEGIPFLRLKGLPMTTWGRIMKRLFDIVVSFILIVLCSPLFLLIAILVKLTSNGHVLYSQERISLDGKSFTMLKFRSMRLGAESQTGPVWAKLDDNRATPIGNFLRRTSLDELPQLFNVLKGEMSLVGPRPERPYFVEKFRGLVPKYLDRHRVKTGMTGWAQVNGLRGDSSLEERIKFDIYYIENWSFLFDVKILLRTIGALVERKKKV
jgi:exopolysaccharide biosynthesis polyprenyl glycosylphosphotransferase